MSPSIEREQSNREGHCYKGRRTVEKVQLVSIFVAGAATTFPCMPFTTRLEVKSASMLRLSRL